MKIMQDIDLKQKRVMIRSDLNVPLNAEGQITDDARIRAALPAYQQALKAGAAVLVLSHLGRPVEGEYDAQFSLAPVAQHLEGLLGQSVRLEKEWLAGVDVQPGEIVLCENVRFNVGEKKNNADLAKKMATLCDVFVMDAFGTAHRKQASTYGVAEYAAEACMGPLLGAEVQALQKVLGDPERPLLAIVGGAKVSSKLAVLESLADKVDQLIVGGGIANTFIAASGYGVGASLCEADLIETAKRIQAKTDIPLPEDVVVAKTFAADAPATVKALSEVAEDDMILDIGPKAAKAFAERVKAAKTVVWNGPVGVFEFDAFSGGTRALAQAVAESPAFSVAGGGDTIAAINAFEVDSQVDYISTGGGAFLEFLEGKQLPALEVLARRDQ